MTVSPEAFVDEMEALWTSKLGNHSSPQFRELWNTMAKTYQSAIHSNMSHKPLQIGRPDWLVMSPEMGAGKTVGACLYFGLMCRKFRELPIQIGGLMVCRTIDQCEQAVHDINDHAGFTGAITTHSKNTVSYKDALSYPILVITHQALIDAGRDGRINDLVQINNGRRCLTIIDEALANAIEFHNLNAQKLHSLLGFITSDIRSSNQVAVGFIEALLGLLTSSDQDQTSDELIWNRDQIRSSLLDEFRPLFQSLDKDIRKAHARSFSSGWNDPDKRQVDMREITDTLRSIQTLLQHWAIYIKSGNELQLRTAQSLIPRLISPVVLNATAAQDPLIDYIQARQVPTPRVRNYKNLIIRVLRSDGIGKGKMKECAENRLANLSKFITDNSSVHDKWLVVTHKITNSQSVKHLPEGVMTAYWGALDGLNDFKECNKAILFGISYKDPHWSSELYYALKGSQADGWLKSLDAQAIKRSIDTKLITAQIIQAIGRPQCRRVCDEHGNCLPTTIYLTLPAGIKGIEIIKQIQQSLYGVVIEEWDYDLDKSDTTISKPTVLNARAAVVTFMKQCPPGRYYVNDIAKELSFSSKETMNVKDALKKGRNIVHELSMIGVTYEAPGMGKHRQATLIKEMQVYGGRPL